MLVYRFLVTLLFQFLCIASVCSHICITEVCSSGSATVTDCYGKHADWIELYNASGTPENTAGLSLSDNRNGKNKLRLPGNTLQPGAFMLVYANNSIPLDFRNAYAPFKLKSSGETLYLFDSTAIIDSVVIPALEFGQSYAQSTPYDRNNPDWHVADLPTPQTENSSANISFSHTGGVYGSAFSLSLSTASGAQIYYTTDGSTPACNAQLYAAPIRIFPRKEKEISLIPTTMLEGQEQLKYFIWKEPADNFNTVPVIRCAAFKDGRRISKIYTQTYFIDSQIGDFEDFNLISIATDKQNLFDKDTGIYVPGSVFENNEWVAFWPSGNYHAGWKRHANVEVFSADRQSRGNGPAYLNMRGGGSASYPQKSFKVSFRSHLGKQELAYPILGDSLQNRYKSLALRNSGNDVRGSHFLDAFAQSLLEGVDVETQAFAPSHVYINGEYWGIYNIREAYDRFYFEDHFGVEEANLSIVGKNGNATTGENAQYDSLIRYIQEHTLEEDAHYTYVCSQIDIENFIDYQIFEIYCANRDWPAVNMLAWRDKRAHGKWRWLVYDLDFGWADNSESQYTKESLLHATEANGPSWPNPPQSTFLLRALLKNNNFRAQFLDKFAFHLQHTFAPDRVLAKLDYFSALYKKQIQYQIDRWGYPADMAAWENRIAEIREFAVKRPCFLRSHIMDYFSLANFGYDCIAHSEEQPVTECGVFPNPACSAVTVQATYPINAVSLLNMEGVVALSEQFGEQSTRLSIDCSHLPAGVYIIQVALPHKQEQILFHVKH